MQELKSRQIILASQSPRRRELLAQMGLQFEIHPACGEEIITSTIPWQVVEELSMRKAEEIYRKDREDRPAESILVIGADTIVVLNGRILGKPQSQAEACEMLRSLQGQKHQVYTGVTLIWNEQEDGVGCVKKQHTFHEETEVEFYPMTEQEIEEYVATDDCMDKAGAYGIQTQSGVYIRGICGDYNNVVGLPIARLYHELRKIFARR
jgi:septum formation protein